MVSIRTYIPYKVQLPKIFLQESSTEPLQQSRVEDLRKGFLSHRHRMNKCFVLITKSKKVSLEDHPSKMSSFINFGYLFSKFFLIITKCYHC